MPTTARSRPRVVVVGGSLAGLNAALWLREAGCDADVFERSPVRLEGRGAGIVLHPATIRYLVEHGVAVEELGEKARRLRYLGKRGELLDDGPCPYRFTSYNALYEGLRVAWADDRYHLGAECTGCEQDERGATAVFADGRRERGDLLVFADGVNSTGRRQLFPDRGAVYAGYVAWRGTIAPGGLDEVAFEELAASITYYVLVGGGHVLVYPIPERLGGAAGARRLINWLWYRNVPSGTELEELLTDRGGVRLETSVPPGRVAQEQLRTLVADAERALPPQLAAAVAATAEPFIQVVFDIDVPQMAVGRVCLVGDAAFTLRPHVAAGSAKAAEDAWALGRAMREAGGDVDTALRAWEPGQLALGRSAFARSREAGGRLQSGRWRAGEQLAYGLYRQADGFMA